MSAALVAAAALTLAGGCGEARGHAGERAAAAPRGGSVSGMPVWHIPFQPRAAVELMQDGRRVLALLREFDDSTPEQFERTYKPYLHVYDGSGVDPITKGTGGLYPHHRGVFVGWNKVRVGEREVDFWHMRGGAQRVLSTECTAAAPGQAGLALEVAWLANDGQVLVREQRNIIAQLTAAPMLARFDLVSTLVAPFDADVALDGDPEHAGVQFRASDAVNEGPAEGKATYTFERTDADPKIDRDLRWVLMSFRIGARRYHVLHMNDPHNPTPTLYSAYRDYGRFGAFFRAVIPRGGTLSARYGFAVFEGDPPPRELIERCHAEFASNVSRRE